MKKRVLVVDDDPDIRRTLRAAFADIAEVFEAPNGVEALRLMTLKPHLVLLDMSMPGMSGLETLQELKKEPAPFSVMILTSEHDIDTARKALNLGATVYVTKPFDLSYLRDEVRRLLALPEEAGDDGRPWRVAS
jgi:DNA-binding response OmpR family regulator